MITPYFAQIRKIRKLLKTANIQGVQVASVEEFQGQVRLPLSAIDTYHYSKIELLTLPPAS